MKRLITILALVCGMASLQAQDLQIGPKAGYNSATLSGDGESPDSRTGIRVGGFAEIPLSDGFFLQPELLYSSKGHNGFLGFGELTLNYLSVPVIAKYAFVNKDGLQVFGQAGPYAGFLLSAEQGGEDVSDNRSSLDFGGQFGVGVSYDIGPGSLTLDVRAGVGLTNVYDSGNSSNGSSNNSGSITFTGGSSNSTNQTSSSGTASEATNQIAPSATVGYAFSL